jgi:hypothetical protein
LRFQAAFFLANKPKSLNRPKCLTHSQQHPESLAKKLQ